MKIPQNRKFSIFQIIVLICLFFFSKKKFNCIEEADNESRNTSELAEYNRAAILRKVYSSSLLYVVVSVFLGYLFSFIMNMLNYVPLDGTINLLQLCSGLIFLWATFSLGGWPIQSYLGDTLTELVNLWVFRGSYLLGTILIVISLTW